MRSVIRGIVDFVVGDDSWIAVAVVLLLGTAAALERLDIDAWWVLPVGVPAALWVSLARARRAS
jgi:hypothetical protein